MWRFLLLTAAAIAALSLAATKPKQDAPAVSVLRVPESGLQPQVEVKDGVVHLLYFNRRRGRRRSQLCALTRLRSHFFASAPGKQSAGKRDGDG